MQTCDCSGRSSCCESSLPRFDLPPFYLGVERDVNRSTAEEMNDMAFRQAIVPTARLLAEQLTRDAIAKRLGWNDLEFVFADLDATDPLEEAQIQQILLQSGVLTVNEVRRMRGLPEIGRWMGNRGYARVSRGTQRILRLRRRCFGLACFAQDDDWRRDDD